MQRAKTVLLILAFAMMAVTAWSQFNANSPYSRFGIGDPVNSNFMGLQSMGSMGNAYADPFTINIVNPASIGFLDYTSYDLGVFAKYTNLDDGNVSDGLWNGNLAYLSLAFPLSNPINEILDRIDRKSSWGMSISLLPNSVVGYDIESTTQDVELGQITNTFRGSGGTYKFVLGNGYRRGNLSVGLNLAYAFGNIQYDREVSFDDVDLSFDDQFSNEYSLSGFKYDLGLMYALDLNKAERESEKSKDVKRLMLGLRFNSATGFSTKSDILNRSVLLIGTTEVNADTLLSEVDREGSGNFAPSLGIGATYMNGSKSALGLNIDYTNWSSFENEANPSNLSNTFRVSIGGFLRPDYKSFNKYFKRVYYRYGLYYGTDPRLADEDQITNYGLTFGMGLPFIYQRKISHANLGFELGFRGHNTPIKETFAKINFSFSFNDDEWFIKRKYD